MCRQSKRETFQYTFWIFLEFWISFYCPDFRLSQLTSLHDSARWSRILDDK